MGARSVTSACAATRSPTATTAMARTVAKTEKKPGGSGAAAAA